MGDPHLGWSLSNHRAAIPKGDSQPTDPFHYHVTELLTNGSAIVLR